MVGGAAAWPLAGYAQQSRPLVAILSPSQRDGAHLKNINEPFKESLVRLGWEAGRNANAC